MSQVFRIGRQQLPADLRARLASPSEVVVLRDHPDSQKQAPRYWLLLPLVALTVFGGLTALLVPEPPFRQPLSIALFAGAGALGALLGSMRLRSLRPEAGQRLVIGTSTLVLVHRDAVEVIPGAAIRIAEGSILVRGEPFDAGGHDAAWMAELEGAMESARRGEEDPWMAAASENLDSRGPRQKAVLMGAFAGLALALALELIPAANATKGDWDSALSRFDAQVAWMNEREDALLANVRKEFDERLPKVSTLMEAAVFYVDTKFHGIGKDFDEPALELLQRFVQDEIEDKKRTESMETILTLPMRDELPEDIVTLAADRFREDLEARLLAAPTVENCKHVLNESDRLGLGYDNAKALLERVAKVGEDLVDGEEDGSLTVDFASMCTDYVLSSEFCDPIKERFADVADAQLSSPITADEFFAIQTLADKLQISDSIREPLNLRATALSEVALRESRDGASLAVAMDTWQPTMRGEALARLQDSAAKRALTLSKKSESSHDAAKLLPWMLGEAREDFFEQYQNMAAKEAQTGSIEDAQAFLAAQDFASHPERVSVEKRIRELCDGAYSMRGKTGDDTLTFFSALLTKMCVDGTKQVQFRKGMSTNLGPLGSETITNIDEAAAILVAEARTMAELLGRPMELRADVATTSADIELTVSGFAPIGSMSYPCTLYIKRLFPSDAPEEISMQGTCVRILERSNWR